MENLDTLMRKIEKINRHTKIAIDICCIIMLFYAFFILGYMTWEDRIIAICLAALFIIIDFFIKKLIKKIKQKT